VHIHDGPLPDEPIALHQHGAGAVIEFEGIVRPSEDGRDLDGLNYQTYDPMAENSLRTLSEQACERFGLIGLSVEHSRGHVPVGRRSFRLRIASAHRKEALAATDWFIDVMKRDVPIWKQPAFVTESEASTS
jgi:molybdopterin synthase catalytic subunit